MEATRPKPLVFVLMPFEPAFDDVYKLGIKPACEAAGAYCERVDEQIFSESILQRIYNQISKADVIVADMTGRNPNVFYETGYAHALGARVVLLTQNADDIPFDLKHYPHIVYEARIADLKEQLEQRVHWFLENPEALPREVQTLEFSIHGHRISSEREESISTSANERNVSRFGVNIHNPSDRVFEPAGFEIGLVCPYDALAFTPASTVVLPGEVRKWMLRFRNLDSIPPRGWASLFVDVVVHENGYEQDLPCELRIFDQAGFHTIPFSLKFCRKDE